MREIVESFDCFGGRCSVRVTGEDERESAAAVAEAKRALLDAHLTLSRFDPESELSRLNRDPRREVPASPLLRRVVAGALAAGMRSGGLVDATMVDEIEAAGYAASRDFDAAGSGVSTPPPRPAAANASSRWCELAVDERAGTVVRPPGLRIDPGGIAKGVLADRIAEALADFPAFAVDCCGDLRVGGLDALTRTILVDDPLGGGPVHRLRIAEGAVATSGITRRSWTDDAGNAAHQILDPATGRPAFTGVTQATAVAPSGLFAETLAKSALLVGPERAESQLPFGGVIVTADGAVDVCEGLAPLVPSGLIA